MKNLIILIFLMFTINLYGSEKKSKPDSVLKVWILTDGTNNYDSYRIKVEENGFSLKFLWLSNLVTFQWNEKIQELIPYKNIENIERKDIGKSKVDVYHMIFYVDSIRYELKWEDRKQRDHFLKLLSSVIPNKLEGTGLKIE